MSLTRAVDNRPRERHWANCSRFSYLTRDITKDGVPYYGGPTIVTAVHPCRDLAPACIKAFVESKAEYMVLMPCCEGKLDQVRSRFLDVSLSRYERWCLHLEGLFPETMRVRSYRDKQVESPCNIIIVARRLSAEGKMKKEDAHVVNNPVADHRPRAA